MGVDAELGFELEGISRLSRGMSSVPGLFELGGLGIIGRLFWNEMQGTNGSEQVWPRPRPRTGTGTGSGTGLGTRDAQCRLDLLEI